MAPLNRERVHRVTSTLARGELRSPERAAPVRDLSGSRMESAGTLRVPDQRVWDSEGPGDARFRASMLKRFPSATGPLAGALGGVVVGIVDGLRAGWLVGAGSRALLASALLAGAADALLAATAGALIELVARVAAWGWRAGPARPRASSPGVLAGAGAAAGAATGVIAARQPQQSVPGRGAHRPGGRRGRRSPARRSRRRWRALLAAGRVTGARRGPAGQLSIRRRC